MKTALEIKTPASKTQLAGKIPATEWLNAVAATPLWRGGHREVAVGWGRLVDAEQQLPNLPRPFDCLRARENARSITPLSCELHIAVLTVEFRPDKRLIDPKKVFKSARLLWRQASNTSFHVPYHALGYAEPFARLLARQANVFAGLFQPAADQFQGVFVRRICHNVTHGITKNGVCATPGSIFFAGCR